jgi:hypothetical protein
MVVTEGDKIPPLSLSFAGDKFTHVDKLTASFEVFVPRDGRRKVPTTKLPREPVRTARSLRSLQPTGRYDIDLPTAASPASAYIFTGIYGQALHFGILHRRDGKQIPGGHVANASRCTETLATYNRACIESNKFEGRATFFLRVFRRIVRSWNYEETERAVASSLLTGVYKHYSKFDSQPLTTVSRSRLTRTIRTVPRELGTTGDKEHKIRAKCKSLLILMNN